MIAQTIFNINLKAIAPIYKIKPIKDVIDKYTGIDYNAYVLEKQNNNEQYQINILV